MTHPPGPASGSEPDSPRLRVGLIGLGAIGDQVAQGVATSLGGDAQLVGILVRQRGAHHNALAPVFTDLAAFLSTGPQVVLEAAGPAALAAYAEPVLASAAALIAASGSALLDVELRTRIEAACRRHHTRVYLPSGALGGLDALAAAALGDLDEVTLRVVQPGEDERVIFRGDALQAAARFPESMNVAAVTAFVANCAVNVEFSQQSLDRGREIELRAEGSFGDLLVRLHPRSESHRLSHIVALSLLASLRRLQQPIVFG
jgi:aspartate dehydrogenase